MQKLVGIAEKVKPDIILLAGDIIDDHIEPYQEENMERSSAIYKLHSVFMRFRVIMMSMEMIYQS